MEWWNLTDIPVSTYRKLSRIKHSDSIFIDQTNLFTKKTIICFIHLNILECFSIDSTWRFFVYTLTKTFHSIQRPLHVKETDKHFLVRILGRTAQELSESHFTDLWSGVRFFCDRGNVRKKKQESYTSAGSISRNLRLYAGYSLRSYNAVCCLLNCIWFETLLKDINHW